MPQTKAGISIRTSTIKQNAEWLLIYICDECHSLLQSLILTVLVSSGHAMLTEDMLCYHKCINWPYSTNVAVLSAQGTIWGGGGGYPTPTLCPSIQTAGQFQFHNQTLKILISDIFWQTHVKTRTMQLIFNNKSTVHYIKTQFHNSQFILPFKNSNGFFFVCQHHNTKNSYCCIAGLPERK